MELVTHNNIKYQVLKSNELVVGTKYHMYEPQCERNMYHPSHSNFALAIRIKKPNNYLYGSQGDGDEYFHYGDQCYKSSSFIEVNENNKLKPYACDGTISFGEAMELLYGNPCVAKVTHDKLSPNEYYIVKCGVLYLNNNSMQTLSVASFGTDVLECKWKVYKEEPSITDVKAGDFFVSKVTGKSIIVFESFGRFYISIHGNHFTIVSKEYTKEELLAQLNNGYKYLGVAKVIYE